MKEWKRGEAIVKQQIAATIPDSLFMKIRDKGTALEIWEALKGDFQNKSRMVAVDLRRRLQQERCAEKGDVRVHFSKLRTMREDLAAMGHTPGDDEFYAIILGSLPYSFEPFISALNATSSVLGTVLSPDELMNAFTDEYDRRSLGKSSKKEEENAAFSTEEGNGRKGNGQKRGNCYNCGKPGHRKDDCWEEGGGGEKPDWLKAKEKWQMEREGGGNGKAKEKPKAKESATTAEIEEDVAWMAHISDSEDDNDVVSTVSSDEGSVDWWDEQVEGENEDLDIRVDEAGNQPIPQPSVPKKGTELPLAQPEEHGECWGKAANSEGPDDDKWEATVTMDVTEGRNSSYEIAKGEVEWPEEADTGVLPHTSYPKTEPAWEYYPDAAWNPWAVDELEGESGGKAASGDGEGDDKANEANRALQSETGRREVNPSTEGRRKVCPSGVDDPKSVLHPRNPTQSKFDDAESVSTPMNLNANLSGGQHPSTAAEIAKTNNLPYREGTGPPTHTLRPDAAFSIAIDAMTPKIREEPPHFSSDQSRGGGGASWVNPRKHAGGATRLDHVKRDFRGLGGGRDISLARNDEKGHLPYFEDPGGVPQHRRGGYQPIEARRSIPGTPREGANVMLKMEAEEEDAATVGTQMWPCGPVDPIWKTFPPLEIDKPPAPIINDQGHAHTRACDIRDGNHGTPLRLRGSVGI